MHPARFSDDAPAQVPVRCIWSGGKNSIDTTSLFSEPYSCLRRHVEVPPHPLLSPDCLTPRCRPPWAAIFPCRLPMHCWELAELVMLLMRPFSLAPLSRPSQSPMLPGDAPCNSSFGINPETDSSEASLLSLDHRGSMLRPVVGCCIFKMAATARAKVWQVKTLSEGTG